MAQQPRKIFIANQEEKQVSKVSMKRCDNKDKESVNKLRKKLATLEVAICKEEIWLIDQKLKNEKPSNHDIYQLTDYKLIHPNLLL